jgi:AcrR family transcriptional regulator
VTLPPPPLPTSAVEPELRARILEVAVELFADKGYGRTSMREVAAAAGCTKPALYYHFESKEQLFRATIERCLVGLEPILAQVDLVSGSVRDRLVVLARGVFERLRSDPAPMRLMLVMQTRPDQAQPDFDFARYHQENQALLHALFEEGVRTGEIRPDVDLEDAAMALTGALHSRAFLALKGVPAPADTPDRIVDLLFRGIAAGSPPPRG